MIGWLGAGGDGSRGEEGKHTRQSSTSMAVTSEEVEIDGEMERVKS